MKPLFVKIVVCVAICLGLGLWSGLSTADSIAGWYTTINKPSWNPPNWIFGPVWATLYILMGISAALIWHSNHALKKVALSVFAFQFALNLLWSFIFFQQQNIGLALVEIIAMLLMIILTIFLFTKINKAAAWLLVPYLLWVSFATYLNYSIYALNP